MPRGVVRLFYEEALAGSQDPLSYIIATSLASQHNSHVGIATGALSPSLPAGESDGPFGAIVLANALLSLGCAVTLLAEEPIVPVLRALATHRHIDPEIHALDITAPDQHRAIAPQLDALICIEKAGMNPAGLLHSMTGASREGTRAKIDGLVSEMNAAGKLTIGIGDGGNEIGFGNIRDRVKDVVPFGATCSCPCGQGVITATRTRYLYPAAVSNWGAYGLAASIAIETKQLSLLHSPADELAFFRIARDYDCRDGQLGTNGPSVDGVRAETSAAICQIIQNIAELEVHHAP